MPASLDPIDQIVNSVSEACQTINYHTKEADIELWVSELLDPDCYSRIFIEKRLGNLIGPLLFNIVFTDLWSKDPVENTRCLDVLSERLKIKLLNHETNQTAQLEIQLQQDTATARRTRMNTSIARNPNLDHPIERYLDSCTSSNRLEIVDIGVGYPPITTVKTAKKFNDKAHVIGVDVTMPDLVIDLKLNNLGNCHVFFEADLNRCAFIPISAMKEVDESWGISQYENLSGDELRYAIAKAIKAKEVLLSAQAEALYLKKSIDLHRSARTPRESTEFDAEDLKGRYLFNGGTETAEISFQPIRRYCAKSSNLEFRKDDFSLSSVNKVDVIRFGNVLLNCYYTQEEANHALKLAEEKLKEGGIIVIASGDDISVTLQKVSGVLVPKTCTVDLKNCVVPHRLQLKILGIEELEEDILQSTSQINTTGIAGEPMSACGTDIVISRLSTKGYAASITRNRHHCWLYIDLAKHSL